MASESIHGADERTHERDQGEEEGSLESLKKIIKKVVCGPAAWQLSGVGPFFGPIGFSYSYIPSSGKFVVALGPGLVFPKIGFAAGPLFGDKAKAGDILTGWGWGGDYATPFGGGQSSWNEAGSLNGPALGSGEVSIMYGFGADFDVGTICN